MRILTNTVEAVNFRVTKDEIETIDRQTDKQKIETDKQKIGHQTKKEKRKTTDGSIDGEASCHIFDAAWKSFNQWSI